MTVIGSEPVQMGWFDAFIVLLYFWCEFKVRLCLSLSNFSELVFFLLFLLWQNEMSISAFSVRQCNNTVALLAGGW